MDQVRIATEEDAPRIIRMLRNFHAEAGFDLEPNIPYLHRNLVALFDGDESQEVFTVFVIGKPAYGVLIAQIGMSLFFPVRFAEELVMWVEPEQRTMGVWNDLREAYESHMISRGVTKLKMTRQSSIKLRPGAMDRLFRRAGFEIGEVVYFKDVLEELN